MTVIDRSIQVI